MMCMCKLLSVAEGSNKIGRTIKLDSPGYKGHVKNVSLIDINELNGLPFTIDIEMKAMEGIVLRDVYLVSPDGKVNALVSG